jgi:hypothetical protein
MMRGGTPAVAAATTRARGVSPCRFARLPARHDHGAGAVVHAARVAGGDAAALLAEGRGQLGESLQRGVGAEVLVLLHLDGVALAAGDRHRDDLLGEAAFLLRLAGALLRAEGEGVLVGAGDLEVLRHVLRRLRHGVDAVLGLHLGIDEAPADGGVEDLGLAAEGLRALAHDEGGAGHALHASRPA